MTDADLVCLLEWIDFSGNKSAYTQNGDVCAARLRGYIEDAFYRKGRLHLLLFVEQENGTTRLTLIVE